MTFKKISALTILIISSAILFFFCDTGRAGKPKEKQETKESGVIANIMQLAESETPRMPDKELITKLKEKFRKYASQIKNRKLCVLIDYDLPIIAYRLWIIDMKKDSAILNSRVSHAYNSGLMFAENFSNTPETEKSCVGAFITGETYNGSYGYSMKLKGLEKGINDAALARSIVFHPHDALWSLGCFMTKASVNKKIVDLTHDGTLVWVRKTNPKYSNN